MKKIPLQVFFAIFCFFAANISAQYSPNETLLTIGNRSVTAGEFERIYNKNYNLNTAEKQTVTEYFDLFLKFRLKVSAALDEGLDTLASYKKELKGYRDQLAKNYLTDARVTDSLLHEAYDHTVMDVNVSHILILFPENPNAADTLACYKKIADIRKKILAGQSFEKLAVEYSADPSAKQNKGNLGYFSAFRFPYLFERCAYNTKVGDISPILRTNYGYHIIRVNDRRPSPGEIKVAHIMCAVPRNAPDSAWIKAKTRINELYTRVKNGEDFSKLAREVSDDRASAEQDGELPWFSTGRMVPEFETAAFALKAKGEVSQPIKTAYGWHIIKLIDKRGVPSFDQVKTDYKNRIMNDERAEIISTAFINKIKKESVYKIYNDRLSPFYATDSTVYHGKINIDSKVLEKPLITIQKTNFTGADFKAYLEANPVAAKKIPIKEYIDQSFQKFIKASFVKYEDQHLETRYSDFGNLIKEYHDGILLFDIMDSEVWSKATRDSAGLEAFYNNMKEKPMWGERLDAALFSCKTREIADKVKKLISDPGNSDLTSLQITKLVCDSAAGTDCVTVDKKLFSKGDSKTIDSIAWKQGFTDISSGNNRIMFAYVWGIHPPETKKLDDVRGLITADYQNFLEEKWVNELKNKYKVIINQDLLHKIANKYKTAP